MLRSLIDACAGLKDLALRTRHKTTSTGTGRPCATGMRAKGAPAQLHAQAARHVLTMRRWINCALVLTPPQNGDDFKPQ